MPIHYSRACSCMCAYIDTTYILDTCFMYEYVRSCVVCVCARCVCMHACSLLLVRLLVDVGEAAGGGEAALVSECTTVSYSL